MKTGGTTKKKKTVREGRRFSFEMGLTGVMASAAAGVVLVCWIFFLGVWAGQTILGAPVAMDGDKAVAREKAVTMPPKVPAAGAPPVQVSKIVGGEKREKEKAKEFYALQVGAFLDKKKAEQELIRWRSRSEKSFLVVADGKTERYSRVYLGRYARQEDALAHAKRLATAGQSLPRVVRLPAAAGGAKP